MRVRFSHGQPMQPTSEQVLNAARQVLSTMEREGVCDAYFPDKLWERDLLWLAQNFPEKWLPVAICAGFTEEKIHQPWIYADAGRFVELPVFKVVRIKVSVVE